MEFAYSIPLIDQSTKEITLKSGSSAVFVGANGSGKSRLGSYLELKTPYRAVTHRVGAQRALVIPSSASMRDSAEAREILLYGEQRKPNLKEMLRWHRKPTTYLLNDFAQLLTALFSEEFERAMEHKGERAADPHATWPATKLGTVKMIWEEILVARELRIKGPSIHAFNPQAGVEYPADEMSDGERVLFYLVGACLMAPDSGVIIIDEPELHIHKSVLASLWDRIEAARRDCLWCRRLLCWNSSWRAPAG